MVPFGSVGLMLENEISLLAIDVFGLVLQLIILLLDDVLFSLVLASEFVHLSISVDFDLLHLFLEPVPLFLDSLDLLLEAALLREHALGAEFQSLVQRLVLLFEPSDGAVELIGLGSVGLGHILELLLVLGIHLLHDRVVGHLVLTLALILGLVKLVDSLSELLERLLVVLLGLFLLLLKELEFTFPKGFLFFELALKVGVCSLHFVVLALPLLDLFSDSQLTLGQGLVELLILLLESLVFDLVVLDELLLLSLEVLILFDLHGLFPLELGLRLLDVLLDLLEGLSLLLILGLDALLLLLDSGHALL